MVSFFSTRFGSLPPRWEICRKRQGGRRVCAQKIFYSFLSVLLFEKILFFSYTQAPSVILQAKCHLPHGGRLRLFHFVLVKKRTPCCFGRADRDHQPCPRHGDVFCQTLLERRVRHPQKLSPHGALLPTRGTANKAAPFFMCAGESFAKLVADCTK